MKINALTTMAMAVFLTHSAVAQDAPPLVKQINNGNWLADNEARARR